MQNNKYCKEPFRLLGVLQNERIKKEFEYRNIKEWEKCLSIPEIPKSKYLPDPEFLDEK
jgi:hypothetical protein